MTRLERWLIAGSGVLLVALPALQYWSVTRYGVARQAVQKYVEVEAQSVGQGTEAKAAKLTRDEARQSLANGDFEAALLRLTRVAAPPQQSAAPAQKTLGLTPDEIWPPKSPRRAEARRVLVLLAQRQSDGSDLIEVQKALQQVAQQARAGDKTATLAAFDTVKTLLEALPKAGDESPRQRPDRQRPARAVPDRERMRRTFMVRSMPGQPLMPPGNGFIPPAAIPPGFQAGRRFRSVPGGPNGQIPPAFLSRPAPGSMPPALAPQSGGRPARDRPAGDRPSGAGAGPRRLVAMPDMTNILDSVRSMPEPVYRKRRTELALALAQSLGTGGGPAGTRVVPAASRPDSPASAFGPPRVMTGAPIRPKSAPTPRATPASNSRPQTTPKPRIALSTPPRPTPTTTMPTGASLVSDDAALRLNFGPEATIRGLSAAGYDLSAGLEDGGISLILPGKSPAPLRGLLKASDENGERQSFESKNFAFSYRETKAGLEVTATARGERLPPKSVLLFEIPLRALSWNWEAEERSLFIVKGGLYTSNRAQQNDSLRLRNVKFGLLVGTPVGSNVTYQTGTEVLQVRVPLHPTPSHPTPPHAGHQSYTIRLTVEN